MKGDAKFKRKLTRRLKNDIRSLVNFHASSRNSENLHIDWLLLSKAYKDLDERVQKSCVSWHWRVTQTLKKNWLLIPKMTGGFGEFNASSEKSENLHFDVLLLSRAYNVSAKKVQKNYPSWHWGVIQTLKKTDFLFETWEIWWIFTQVVESNVRWIPCI